MLTKNATMALDCCSTYLWISVRQSVTQDVFAVRKREREFKTKCEWLRVGCQISTFRWSNYSDLHHHRQFGCTSPWGLKSRECSFVGIKSTAAWSWPLHKCGAEVKNELVFRCFLFYIFTVRYLHTVEHTSTSVTCSFNFLLCFQ
jgi:hypothetical protein